MKKILFTILSILSILSKLRADSAFPIRLAADQAVRQSTPIDLNTGQSPIFIRGDDLEFQIGFFLNGTLLANWTNIAAVTVGVWDAQNSTNPPLIFTNQLVSAAGFNTNLTIANWTNGAGSFGTNQHADIFIPSALSSITLNGQASQGYWLRVFLTTTNAIVKTFTALEGPITVFDGPIQQVAPAIVMNGLIVDGAGNLVSPTNFFAENTALLQQALAGGRFALTNDVRAEEIVNKYIRQCAITDIVASVRLTGWVNSLKQIPSGTSNLWANCIDTASFRQKWNAGSGTNCYGINGNIGNLWSNAVWSDMGIIMTNGEGPIVFTNLPNTLAGTLIVYYEFPAEQQPNSAALATWQNFSDLDNGMTARLSVFGVTGAMENFAYNGASFSHADTALPWGGDNNPHALAGWNDNVALVGISMDGGASITGALAAPSAVANTKLVLGAEWYNNAKFIEQINGIIMGFALFNLRLSDAQLQAVFTNAQATLFRTSRVVLDGDSIPPRFASYLLTNFGTMGQIYEVVPAIIGQQTSDLIANFPTGASTNAPNGGSIPSAYYINNAGIHDLVDHSDTAAYTFSNNMYLAREAANLGMTPVVLTLMEGTNFFLSSADETQRELYNGMVTNKQNAAAWGYIPVDIDRTFFNLLGTNYWTNDVTVSYFAADGVHPTNLGCLLIATNINAVLQPSLRDQYYYATLQAEIPPAGAGSGSVTSVAATSDNVLFTVSGSPITTAGTLAFTSVASIPPSEILTAGITSGNIAAVNSAGHLVGTNSLGNLGGVNLLLSGGLNQVGPETNQSLTASEFLATDANKKIVSTLNGSSLVNGLGNGFVDHTITNTLAPTNSPTLGGTVTLNGTLAGSAILPEAQWVTANSGAAGTVLVNDSAGNPVPTNTLPAVSAINLTSLLFTSLSGFMSSPGSVSGYKYLVQSGTAAPETTTDGSSFTVLPAASLTGTIPQGAIPASATNTAVITNGTGANFIGSLVATTGLLTNHPVGPTNTFELETNDFVGGNGYVLTNLNNGHVGAVKAASGGGSGAFATLFTTTNINISDTVASAVSIAHGLGGVPSYVHCVLVCTTNDAGSKLVVGQEIPIEQVFNNSNTRMFFSCFVDSANVYVNYEGDTATKAEIANTSGGSPGNYVFTSFGHFALKAYVAK